MMNTILAVMVEHKEEEDNAFSTTMLKRMLADSYNFDNSGTRTRFSEAIACLEEEVRFPCCVCGCPAFDGAERVRVECG
jgi:hypothetical protein